MEVQDAPPTPKKLDDLTAIDVELVSCCFSEDEDIVEWQTLIDDGLD